MHTSKQRASLVFAPSITTIDRYWRFLSVKFMEFSSETGANPRDLSRFAPVFGLAT